MKKSFFAMILLVALALAGCLFAFYMGVRQRQNDEFMFVASVSREDGEKVGDVLATYGISCYFKSPPRPTGIFVPPSEIIRAKDLLEVDPKENNYIIYWETEPATKSARMR